MIDTRSVEAAFRARFGTEPRWIAWAPGRVNLIGEHTDYTGGLAMPAAIDRRVLVALSPRSDRRVRVFSEDVGEETSFEETPDARRMLGWSRYVAGFVAVHREARLLPSGFDALVTSDVPMGAGLSSSAAFEVALANGVRAMFASELTDLELARLCQRVENEHLGLPSGLLDQMASQLARAGSFTLVDFRDLSWRHISARLDGWALVVIDSGLQRELAASAYEERVGECRRGLALLGEDDLPRHARDLEVEELEEHGKQSWAGRLRHIVEENARVLRMEKLLSAGEIEAAAELLSESHVSLRDLFEVSTPEMDRLQESALEWNGCHGARMIGGGFGGSLLAVLERRKLSGFSQSVLARHKERTGRNGRAWEVHPADGAGAARAGR